MSEAPIKTCEYCGAVGEMPTFMDGETICYECMESLPKSIRECRKEIARQRDDWEVVAAAVAAAEREACAALLESNAQRCDEESVMRLTLEANAAAIRARKG